MMPGGRQTADSTGSPFREFFDEVRPIAVLEPLAETLGAFRTEGAVLSYSFADVVRMAGHACPTVAGAYIACRKALEMLYPDSSPVRGEVSIRAYGDADEGVYGVMGQVFSLITGAAPLSGFRGLGHRFRRKDLLTFVPGKTEEGALRFEFRRTDTGRAVLITLYLGSIPLPEEKGRRLGELLERVLWDASSEGERKEFQDLWMARVREMLVDEKGIQDWLVTEELGDDHGEETHARCQGPRPR